MKKVFILSVILLTALSTSVFAKAKPRTMNASAQKITTLKKAQKIAENYSLEEVPSTYETPELKNLNNKNFKTADIFITASDEDVLMYYKMNAQDKSKSLKSIIFSYSCIDGKATSFMQLLGTSEPVYLGNSDKTFYFGDRIDIDKNASKEITKTIIKQREDLKKQISKEYGIEFKDEICAEQLELMK